MVSGKRKAAFGSCECSGLASHASTCQQSPQKKVSGHDVHASRTQPGIYSWDGRYLGWDPDPNIRFQLMRDQNLPPD
jgi:hypothetical protein